MKYEDHFDVYYLNYSVELLRFVVALDNPALPS